MNMRGENWWKSESNSDFSFRRDNVFERQMVKDGLEIPKGDQHRKI